MLCARWRRVGDRYLVVRYGRKFQNHRKASHNHFVYDIRSKYYETAVLQNPRLPVLRPRLEQRSVLGSQAMFGEVDFAVPAMIMHVL